jgi:hypothetical protein
VSRHSPAPRAAGTGRDTPRHEEGSDRRPRTQWSEAAGHPDGRRRASEDPRPAPNRIRPELDDATVDAVGRLSEALEWVERARGALYEFHQLCGRADLTLNAAIGQLEDAGHPRTAALVRGRLHGRNVLDGRWTFQIVEEYDDLYYRPFVEVDEEVRRRLTDGARHVHEARMKARERARAGRDLWGPGA